MTAADAFLVGFDLVKDVGSFCERAYDDEAGVTAQVQSERAQSAEP